MPLDAESGIILMCPCRWCLPKAVQSLQLTVTNRTVAIYGDSRVWRSGCTTGGICGTSTGDGRQVILARVLYPRGGLQLQDGFAKGSLDTSGLISKSCLANHACNYIPRS